MRNPLRALFRPTDGERHVEELIASRGRELEERTLQLTGTLADLERREERTHQLRNVVEEMLRSGSAELDERQSQLHAFASQLAERESSLRALESELAERRKELGAVELHRAALGRREHALEEREQTLERISSELAERERCLLEDVQEGQRLLAQREAHLAAREAAAQAATAEPARVAPAEPETAHVLFVPGDRYRIVERDGPAPENGAAVELEGTLYRVAQTGASPLPADRRRCVFLEAADSLADEPD